jgi:hypothetical protein
MILDIIEKDESWYEVHSLVPYQFITSDLISLSIIC